MANSNPNYEIQQTESSGYLGTIYGNEIPPTKPSPRRTNFRLLLGDQNLSGVKIKERVGEEETLTASDFPHKINLDQVDSKSSKIKALKDELQHLKVLPSNWNSYGAEVPNNVAIKNAEIILDFLFDRGMELFPKRIVPSAEGGVAFAYIDGSKYADIECFNEGKIFVGISQGTKEPVVWEITTEQQELNMALEEINAFLKV